MTLEITTVLNYDFAAASIGDDAITFDLLPGSELTQLRTSAAADAIVLLGGNDTASDNDEGRLYFGNSGIDDCSGNGGNDTLLGGRDNDRLDGGSQDDLLTGNKGDDFLTGGADQDILYGNEGNDSLSGDVGFDTLTGGEGVDVFYLAAVPGTDSIADFQDTVDKFLLPDGVAFSSLQIVDSGGSAIISIAGQQVAIVNGIPAAALASDDFVGGVPAPVDPGNAPGNALDLGVLTGTRRFNEFVGSSDTHDYYKFEVTTPIEFQVFMDGLSANADIRLYQDVNLDNQVSSNESLWSLTRSYTSSELESGSLKQGHYFLDVYPDSQSENTNYKLQLTNLSSEATNLGDLTGTQTFSGFLDPENLRDDYRFSLTEAKTFTLSLNNLTDNADVRLYKDGNDNGLIDDGEFIDSLTRSGTSSESTQENLTIGDYWLEVYTDNAGSSTPYNLTISA